MNLQISNNPRYIEYVDFIRMQGWAINDVNDRGFDFSYSLGGLNVSPFYLYEIEVKDVMFRLGSYINDYTLRTYVEYESGYVGWLNVPLVDLNFPLTGTRVKRQFEVYPSMSQNGIPGTHNAQLVFQIISTVANEEVVESEFKVPFSLNVFQSGHYFTPSKLSIIQPISSMSFKELTIKGNSWRVDSPKEIMIFESDTTINPDGSMYITGSGERIIRIGVNNDHSSFEYYFNRIFPLKISYQDKVYTLPVTVLLFEDYSPKNITFNSSSGLLDKSIQNIYFKETGSYSVRAPYWLKTTKKEGETRYLEVKMTSPDNFGTGTYSGIIQLVFATKTISIPVTLNSFDGFNLGLRNEEIVFSETTPVIVFSTNSIQTHIEMEVLLDDGSSNLFEFSYKIPFFKRLAEFSLAEVLTRMLQIKNYHVVNFVSQNLPMLSLKIKEVNNLDQVVKSYEKSSIPVLSGLRPVLVNELGILQTNNEVERFTRSGVAVVNIVSQSGSFDYDITINNDVVESNKNVSGRLRSVYINFMSIGAVEGNTVLFSLKTPSGSIEKSFFIVPDEERSNTIFFKNKYKLTSSIEFTGKVIIESAKKRKTERYKDNGKEKTRVFLESSDDTLIIQTGYILLSQIESVNELLDSDEAWFYQNGLRFTMVPITEKIVKLDTEDFLINKKLEFIINEKEYAQIYF